MCRPVNAFRGLGVETGRRTSSARLQRIACGAGTPNVSKRQRRRSESNRRIEVLQTSALPLGYGAARRKLAIYLDFLNPSPEVLPTSFKPLSCRTRRVKNGRDCWPSKPTRPCRGLVIRWPCRPAAVEPRRSSTCIFPLFHSFMDGPAELGQYTSDQLVQSREE